jgi:hypothetical protein
MRAGDTGWQAGMRRQAIKNLDQETRDAQG